MLRRSPKQGYLTTSNALLLPVPSLIFTIDHRRFDFGSIFFNLLQAFLQTFIDGVRRTVEAADVNRRQGLLVHEISLFVRSNAKGHRHVDALTCREEAARHSRNRSRHASVDHIICIEMLANLVVIVFLERLDAVGIAYAVINIHGLGKHTVASDIRKKELLLNWKQENIPRMPLSCCQYPNEKKKKSLALRDSLFQSNQNAFLTLAWNVKPFC